MSDVYCTNTMSHLEIRQLCKPLLSSADVNSLHAFEISEAYITVMTCQQAPQRLLEVFQSHLAVMMDLEEMQLFLMITR